MIKYCESTCKTKRRKTREVMIGKVGVGGNNPIRIQSMTTSNTRDIEATINQIIRLADAGCEIARVTVQGMKEANACEEIKNGLLQRGYTIPIVADIHFFPPAAMRVVDFVDKVRVNPGNYVDRRASFKTIEYDDASYAKEIEKIEEKFTPLVEKCKSLKRAMRIGTNHGSLSDRIMNRYGDTPQGMVESALEFARVCRKNDYHDFMFSMKSSNPQVMILAYRLLVAEMMALGWDYPLHLGVTEAGEGEDGRVKSAMGIGSLLLDGIGETIRVSLTEEPWYEIDPCQRLIALAAEYEKKQGIPPFEETYRNLEKIERRLINLPRNISLHKDGTVLISVNKSDVEDCGFYKKLGCDVQLSFPKLKRASSDCIVLDRDVDFNTPALKNLQEMGMSVFSYNPIEGGVKLISLSEVKKNSPNFDKLALMPSSLAVIIKDEFSIEWENLLEMQPELIVLAPEDNRLHYCRQFFNWLQMQKLQTPVILHFNYSCTQEDLIIQSSTELGALLCDGLGDGIWLKGPYEIGFLRNLSFIILQSARMRTFKTNFISCPSCGRTLFDLQDVSKRIRARTSHLPGVKIAIMGCIVNGPGEMVDADFGYVGSKPGKIDLYLGKTCVEKDIDFANADDRLIELIKKQGRWVDPEITQETTWVL
ncbi:(E)-4-hydroxy-3-methylbut-2-enyl-diphosphate synthase [Candidatus Rhabdochlamydia porcellionis]|jgi:(E)-4-hydroxy-3-methylbut-2-enyl-diphosphate synthase|uniref:4-hydroxy-3-methylbut-2-en-1-yl diphosphate synthase (flavodoxin) n=1 Tax=Candidatus Rhabdochlamydia porcellionis TaxID=225148 RepID=A0ABX8Z4K3_9BACT|nr:(E)-4-hydroxy-3-methylbut-2-enyl-diphosphate synthase [Candidatus Rhabdochlamydia porcellionis]QZA59238.1 4-hydroxy-3-methylbut-2-en-1-yl diphosphate synthase (ferredoxin) [Candidatus Rhabdochlamydia porcellionis]